MYELSVLTHMLSVIVIGVIALYSVHWLVAHRTLYKRFFALAITVLLLIGCGLVLNLNIVGEVHILDAIQRELTAIVVLLSCTVFTQLCGIIIWNGLLVKNGRPIFPKVLVRFINFLIFVIAFFLIIQFVYHFNITKLLVASSLVALVIAYGAQSTLSNVFSGISLNITRNMEIGDWIEIEMMQGVLISGFIESLDWRCVTLKNYEENLVVIPNIILAEKIFVNYSQPLPMFKQEFMIKVAYTIRPDEAISYIKKALLENINVVKDKDIEVHLSALEGDSASYHIEFFTKKYVNHDIKDEMIRALYYQALRQHHSAAPFVTFSLIKHPSDAVDIERQKMISLLSAQAILNCLQPDELNELIDTADFARFAVHETLLQQGVPNTCIFILFNGSIQIEQKNAEDDAVLVLTTIHDFAFIGEYSMLLDELPRQTVRCISESLVMIIRREAFHRIITKRIEIIELIKDIIESRQSQNISEISNYQHQQEGAKKNVEGSVLERLKNIFNAHDDKE